MTTKEIIGFVVVGLITVVCIRLLWVIIRFSIISSVRTKGSQNRLNQPETAAVAQKWGVELPDSLDAFYRSDAVARTEFILKPAGEPDGEGWYISGYLPLTIRDITEELAASKVPGIPLAHDAARGIYYLPFAALRRGESPVLLRNLERRSDTTVAPSFDEFTRLEAEQKIVDD